MSEDYMLKMSDKERLSSINYEETDKKATISGFSIVFLIMILTFLSIV